MGALFTRLVSLCLIVAIPVLLAAQDTAPRETVLNHVSVIDMTGRAVQPDMAVLIRGDRIAAIERATGFNHRPGARVIDLTGKFLLPGLVDNYFYASRLRSEPLRGIDDVHFHPTPPRTARLNLVFGSELPQQDRRK